MRESDEDDRSQLAKAYQRAWQVITASIGMIVPGLVGLYVDRLLGTMVLFALLGFSVGMSFGIYALVRIAGSSRER